MSTNIALIEIAGPYVPESDPLTSQLTTLAPVASDTVNGNNIKFSGDILVLFTNTDVGAQTVTIQSGADSFGRLADITAFSLAADAQAVKRFKASGWEQSLGAGLLEFTTSDAGITVVAWPV